jgi:hypothetical protein
VEFDKARAVLEFGNRFSSPVKISSSVRSSE